VRLRASEISLSNGARTELTGLQNVNTFIYNGVRQVAQTTGTDSEETDIFIYTFQYAAGVKIVSDEEEAAAAEEGGLLEIRAIFDAEYTSSLEVHREEIDEFSKENVGYHVWPYWREYVQSSLARMDLPNNLISVPFYFVASAIATGSVVKLEENALEQGNSES